MSSVSKKNTILADVFEVMKISWNDRKYTKQNT